MFGCTFHLQTTVSDAQTDAGSKPFTHHHVPCGSQTVAEFTLFVLVAKIDLCTTAYSDEPVAPESGSFYFELVFAILHLFFHGGSLCKCRTKSQRTHGH